MKRRALGIILTLAVLLCGVPFALLTQADTSDTAKPVLIMLEDHESLTGDGDAANAWKYEVEGDTASYGTFGYSSNGGVDGSKCVWLDYRMPYTWSFYRLDKNITVEGNGLQFWVKNTHAIKVTVEFVSNGEYVGTKQEFDLDAGQKYVSFAWADTGLTAGNTYETRLVFTYPEDHTGQIYVDNLSIYGEDTAEEMDPTHRTHGDDVIIWDDMDYADYAESKQFWNPEHYNINNQGAVGYLETDTENVHGGTGTSLKMDYDRTKTNWRSAAWVNMGSEFAPIAVRGEGLTFWFKSDRAGTIGVSSLDKDWSNATAAGIPVIAGENIIQVPWSSFKKDGQPATMTLLRQIVIGFDDEGGNTGTAWLDAIGFYGIEEGSYDEWDLLPPDSYEDYIDGTVSAEENFDQYSGEEDLDFYLTWANTNNANTELVENGDGYAILFTYTLDVNTTANMACYRTYEDIDLGGGLSIYAKANVEAYVELQLTLDGDNDEVYVTHIKTSTDGKTYTIPFSAFWKRDDKSVGIDTTSDHTHTITQMVFVTGYGITPPVVGVDASGSILVDDIQYTNSQKEIARPEAFDRTENGVRFESTAGQFPVLSTLKIQKQVLDTDAEELWLEAMGKPDASIYTMLEVIVENMNGKSVDPEGQVKLTFDLPNGATAENVSLYMCYMDGSAEKQEITVSDGKAILNTYFLGTFALVVEESPGGSTTPNTGVALPMVGLVLLLVSAGTVVAVRRKKN